MEREVTITEIVKYVDLCVLQYNGKGFTIKVLPEITKHIAYAGHVPLFGKYTYRPMLLDSGGDTNIQRCLHKVAIHSPVDWSVIIPKEISKSFNKLPNGITINRAPKSTLLDERDTSHDHNGRSQYYVDYAEGHKVTISVSDEYASKIFKKEYSDIGIPFRKLLLEKHSHILNEIANFLYHSPHFHSYNSFSVNDYRVGYDRFSSDEYSSVYITFEKFDMKPLSSLGRKYGMALAIIDTLKKNYPEYCNAIFTTQNDRNSIYTRIQIPSQPNTTINKKLKDW